MCGVLEVSRSGYYDWSGRGVSQRSIQNKVLITKIRKVHETHKEGYGAVKTWLTLKEAGVACGKHGVARLRSLVGIETRRVQRFRLAYKARHSAPPAPNLLRQRFEASGPDQVWMADITFIGTRSGWLYLAVVVDLYSRLVVGWSMKERPTQELVSEALLMAIEQRQPMAGLIHHSDQGIQYASNHYVELLKRHGVVRSMSRKGNCYDNAVVESLFSSLKNELVHHQDYKTRQDARSDIFDYIELFYNRRRKHESLGYHTPTAYDSIKRVA